ncbi:MAG: enoyl-CoA hydratase [Dehalococcoidia bacterium]|nr:enoyl-CoA hydratase [Dehalococcoidia bacterium]
MDLEATILLERRGPVMWLTLNRPQVLNAYNIQMRDELYEALGLIAEDPDVLVAVFRGAGERAFCAGADLTEFGTAPSQAIARRVRFERDVWRRFLMMPKPLIAAVHGYCLGSGLEIALWCDLRIASTTARFGLPETGLGLIPAAGGSQTLPRTIGSPEALRMLLTGEPMTAEEAFRARLISRLVSHEALFLQAQALAEEVASLSPEAVATTKEIFLRGLDTDLERGCDIELRKAIELASLGHHV